jgi:hypothetical protein
MITTCLLHVNLDFHGAPMDSQVRWVNTNKNKEYMYMHILHMLCKYYIIIWHSNALQWGSMTMIHYDWLVHIIIPKAWKCTYHILIATLCWCMWTYVCTLGCQSMISQMGKDRPYCGYLTDIIPRFIVMQDSIYLLKPCIFVKMLLDWTTFFSTAIKLTHPQALNTVQDADCYV